ncbi:PREDICTED: uncharacterized protein LOC108381552, partial [Rhagoletis zephyria]|uniref:uncharacterized protein LOC108381552 n=1 Tax=Rhagoletis zephyria TaxID=28612 RepID=UPI0008113B1B
MNLYLFRSLYQVRCGLRVSPRLPVQVETSIPDTPQNNSHAAEVHTQAQTATNGGSGGGGDSSGGDGVGEGGEGDILQEQRDAQDTNGGSLLSGSACIINGCGASRIFQILYRNEEVALRDVIHFRTHLL